MCPRARGALRSVAVARGAPARSQGAEGRGVTGWGARAGRDSKGTASRTCRRRVRLLLSLHLSCRRDWRRACLPGQPVHHAASHVSARHVTSSAPGGPLHHAHLRTPRPGPAQSRPRHAPCPASPHPLRACHAPCLTSPRPPQACHAPSPALQRPTTPRPGHAATGRAGLSSLPRSRFPPWARSRRSSPTRLAAGRHTHPLVRLLGFPRGPLPTPAPRPARPSLS